MNSVRDFNLIVWRFNTHTTVLGKSSLSIMKYDQLYALTLTQGFCNFRTAFPTWILANILFFFNPRFGAWMILLTGSLQIIANLCFGFIRNFNPLVIPFEDDKLEPHLGWCFWLNLISGVCVCSVKPSLRVHCVYMTMVKNKDSPCTISA